MTQLVSVLYRRPIVPAFGVGIYRRIVGPGVELCKGASHPVSYIKVALRVRFRVSDTRVESSALPVR